MDLLDRIHRTAFLGAEFLTWLWYESEKREGAFAIEEVRGEPFGEFELWFDDKLVVGSAAINAQENLFKGGHPTSSLEAKTALRLGKLAHEAKLRVVHGAREWTFTYKAADMSLASISIPAVLSKEADDKFYERMFLLEELDAVIKGLYGQFLAVRLTPDWGKTHLPAIHAWVGQSAVAQDETPPWD